MKFNHRRLLLAGIKQIRIKGFPIAYRDIDSGALDRKGPLTTVPEVTLSEYAELRFRGMAYRLLRALSSMDEELGDPFKFAGTVTFAISTHSVTYSVERPASVPFGFRSKRWAGVLP